jgi:general secretion pathway protein I
LSALRRGERGFTLIEVLVAFVLLTLVLSLGFQIFSTGMTRASELDDRSRALDIAQSQLAAAGTATPFEQGQLQGDSEDRRFHWTTTVMPTDEGQSPDMPTKSPYLLWRVETRVDWQTAAGRPQQLTLATLGLGQRSQSQ